VEYEIHNNIHDFSFGSSVTVFYMCSGMAPRYDVALDF